MPPYSINESILKGRPHLIYSIYPSNFFSPFSHLHFSLFTSSVSSLFLHSAVSSLSRVKSCQPVTHSLLCSLSLSASVSLSLFAAVAARTMCCCSCCCLSSRGCCCCCCCCPSSFFYCYSPGRKREERDTHREQRETFSRCCCCCFSTAPPIPIRVCVPLWQGGVETTTTTRELPMPCNGDQRAEGGREVGLCVLHILYRGDRSKGAIHLVCVCTRSGWWYTLRH